ncbi:nudix hydrolase 8-like [Olea europaea var. sylvestris]|uniref:nudix hydrolase 8-like n=1 Tax=Olea europaea var. sylvestris TaxID=158386 RepID=UPI000C1D1E20|nr:nudix hydrolase 8-like [Olea europaea var. sylvestris]
MASKVSIYQFPGSFGPKVSWSKSDTAIGFSKSIKSKQFFAKTPDFKLGFSPKQEVEVLSTKIMAPELQVGLLNAWNDDYNGVVIEPTSLPSSANAFASVLKASLSTWKYKEGFVYHHAEPAYVMLTYWIPDEPCVLPLGPSHQIGIAGFVINDNKEILVVKEKCSCSCYGVWKLPTGYINKSEELFSGAVREVKEEIGIDTTFLELVAFRHVHQVAFEKSDLLFVCMLKPLSFIIKIDENEIQDAKWITLDKLISQQFYEEDQMLKRVIEVCMATYENRYSGFISHQLT